MYSHDKQTNKNTKLHTHWAQGARITPAIFKTQIRRMQTRTRRMRRTRWIWRIQHIRRIQRIWRIRRIQQIWQIRRIQRIRWIA